MAAPSGIVWGSAVGSGSYQARIGIYVKLTNTSTETTRHTEIWFWSKYSVSDSSNTFYYNDNATSATTSKGSVSIKTTESSGSGWSTTNQVKIAEYDYTFTRGTSADARSVAAKLTGIDVIGSTMTAKADYTIPALASYTVSYNANGGSGAPSSQKKYYGKTLTLSSTKPTRTGYSFEGWATSASGSVAYKAGASYTANSAVTLYAIWKADTYTVSYNANGGSNPPSSQTKTYGKTLTLSSSKPSRTGYTFQGWATSASGSVSYAAGASYTANAAVTLYAVWKINTYTVSYNANGGSNPPSSQTKTYGKALTLSSTKPTRTGHTFQGWATSSGGSVAYAPGASYTANAAATLYAVWKINTYTVTYNANGGTLGSVKTQPKTYGTALKLTGTATRPDYTFKGWATSAGGSVVYASGANYTANADVTLYAVWERSYEKPKISSISVTRCNSNGDPADDGTYARVKFNWTSSVASPWAYIDWKASADSSWSGSRSIELSDTSGKVDEIIGSGALSTEKSYSIRVTVDDGKDPQSTTKNLPGVVFPIDVLAKGKGVSIGKPAELTDTFDVGFTGKFRKDVEIGEKTKNGDGKTGVHLDADGFIHLQRDSSLGYHPYLGFYLNDSAADNGQIRVNSSTKQMEFLNASGYKFGSDLYLPNNAQINGFDPDGNERNAFQAQNQNGNTIIGYGNYAAGKGNTNVYGNDVNIGSAAAGNAYYRPYRRKGDTSSLSFRTAGYITNNGTDLIFWIPFSVPIIGSPSVSIACGEGFQVRQGNKYLYGSSATVYAIPVSIEAAFAMYNGIYVKAVFSNTTNVTNNDTAGVYFNGTITFE